jgi:hypothetical protein
MRGLALAIVLIGCSSQHADKPASGSLSVIDEGGRGIVTLSSKDELTDGAGLVIGRVDWRAPQVIIGDIRQPLVFDREPTGLSVSTPMGQFHAAVENGVELSVSGKHVGKLVGFSSTKEGWRHLAALVLAIPMLPTPPRGSSPDAAVDLVPPPPPPPPPTKR